MPQKSYLSSNPEYGRQSYLDCLHAPCLQKWWQVSSLLQFRQEEVCVRQDIQSLEYQALLEQSSIEDIWILKKGL